MHRNLAAVLVSSSLALVLAACGGAENEGPAPTTAASAPLTFQQGCEAFFARARACTNEYIDALVSLRIEVDAPAGIAARAAAEGKPAIVADALGEWAEDSTPAAVTATCQRVEASIPVDQQQVMGEAGQRCMDATDCATFSACAMELQRPRIAAGH